MVPARLHCEVDNRRLVYTTASDNKDHTHYVSNENAVQPLTWKVSGGPACPGSLWRHLLPHPHSVVVWPHRILLITAEHCICCRSLQAVVN